MYVVFDVETTGLDTKNDVIIEIAAVELDEQLQKTREFNKTVFQPVRLSKEITKLTGITNKELKEKGEPEEEVMQEFITFVGDQILVAHNAVFDLMMLSETLSRLRMKLDFTFYDTLSMARLMLRWMSHHKLDDVCTELNVELSNHHRSLFDTRATAEVFAILKQMADARGYDFTNLLTMRKEVECTFPHRKLMYPMEAPRLFVS